MAVPNIIFGSLIFGLYFGTPSTISTNTLNPIIVKETGQDLIKKTWYLIISQLNGIIFYFHQIQTPENLIKLSLKSLSLYLTPMDL